MDGVHDMGGRQGFGPVDFDQEHAVAKSDWRSRMFGIELSMTMPDGLSLGWIRHVRECIPPAVSLKIEYYDRWYCVAAGILLNAGWVSLEELKSGKPAAPVTGAGSPLPPDAVADILREGMSPVRPAGGPEAFEVGEAVQVKFLSPPGHIRLPAYVRGRTGRIEAFRGWHALPDAGAVGEDRAEPLYSVSFLARTLWDDVTAPNDRVYLDLWESYLEPA